MNDIQKYPLALQLLMQTDGTVTELIKLLSGEAIKVVKLSEKISTDDKLRILNRCIYLQGVSSSKNWLYAQSKVYLDNLPKQFTDDLLSGSFPIGTLWNNHKIETFKKVINKQEIFSKGLKNSGFIRGVKLLTRTYQVFNQGIIIMEIKENFPIQTYQNLI